MKPNRIRRIFHIKKLSLTAQIGFALVLAVVAGVLLGNQADFVNQYIKPIGTIFLNLLKFIVVPLVLFSVMAGILSMNDISKVGRLGFRALLYFMATTLFAVTLGLVIPSLLKGFFPLIQIHSDTAAGNIEVPHLSVMDQIVGMFPSNIIAPVSSMAMMQVIVIALFFGIAMVHIGEKGEMARKVTLSFNDVVCKILEYIMALAPIGVFCMMTPVVVDNGPSVLGSYAALLVLAYLCFVIHAGLVYSSTVRLLGGLPPLKFFKGMQPAMLFAFSSDSSVATLPYTMQCAEKLGVNKDVSRFDRGRDFEFAFKSTFPDGIDLSAELHRNVDAYPARTAELLDKGDGVSLFEAGFLYDDVLVLADVVQQREDGTLDIYEVKSGTALSETYRRDAKKDSDGGEPTDGTVAAEPEEAL